MSAQCIMCYDNIKIVDFIISIKVYAKEIFSSEHDIQEGSI